DPADAGGAVRTRPGDLDDAVLRLDDPDPDRRAHRHLADARLADSGQDAQATARAGRHRLIDRRGDTRNPVAGRFAARDRANPTTMTRRSAPAAWWAPPYGRHRRPPTTGDPAYGAPPGSPGEA